MSIERRRSSKSNGEKTRREALGWLGGGAIAAGIVSAPYLKEHLEDGGTLASQEAAGTDEVSLEMTGERAGAIECDFKSVYLTGKRCTGLASQYFDLSSGARFPEYGTVNFLESMREMWQQKATFTRRLVEKGKERPDTLRDVIAMGKQQVAQYESIWQDKAEHEGIRNFRSFVMELGETSRDVLGSIDWEGFDALYGIDDEWLLKKVQSFASRAHGRSLAAYSMTEIMPRGDDSLRIYEALIRSGGMAFANRIPAMGDARDSFGPFQLTEIAVDRGINEKHMRRVSAGSPLLDKYAAGEPNRVTLTLNGLLPEEKRVPEHMRDFTTLEQHTTGAVLFAMDNVARAMKTLNPIDGDGVRIDRISHMNGETFASVLAAHHYRPTFARRALIEWTADKNWTNEGEERMPYYEFCDTPEDKLVRSYALASHDNYRRVDAYFAALGD